MKLTPTLERSAKGIVRELFSDLEDRGFVDSYIPQSHLTHDFELPEGHIMRAKEEKGTVYCNVFRAS